MVVGGRRMDWYIALREHKRAVQASMRESRESVWAVDVSQSTVKKESVYICDYVYYMTMCLLIFHIIDI